MTSRGLTILLAVSVAMNVVFAVVWLYVQRPLPAIRVLAPVFRPTLTNILRPVRTNLVISPKVLSWRDIESTNYLDYIANLRAIGCPEATVRDIIVADVDAQFSQRRAGEVVTPDQQWWRSEPDARTQAEAMEKLAWLDLQRRRLLTDLLGPGWDTATRHFEATLAGSSSAGPVLGELTEESRAALRAIESRAEARLREYLGTARREGREPDPVELDRFGKLTRDELAAVLSPAQLEEYLLRYSPTAERLRDQLRGLEATPEEFRALFAATDRLDAELASLAGRTDAASGKRRQELERQREEAMKDALGTGRYTMQKLGQEPGFQQARQAAERIGAPPEAVLPLYQINQAVETEKRRVLANSALSAEEQTQELAAIQQLRLETLRKILGDEAFRKLQLGSD